MKNRICAYSVIILIFLFFSLCLLNVIFPTAIFSENENRYLAKFPEFSFKSLADGSFMKGFDSYASDRFIFRDFFVSAKAKSERAFLKKENNGVFIGKNGYLIQRFESDEKILDSNIQAVKSLSQSGKFRVSLCVVPTAFEVKKHELPDFAYDASEKKVLEKISSSLEGENVSLVQPLDMLLSHKDEYIYYRTDHHQTAEGGYLMYEHLAEALRYEPIDRSRFTAKKLTGDFYGTSWSKVMLEDYKPDEMYLMESGVDITADEGEVYDYSKLGTKDKYAFYLGGNRGIVQINSSVKNGRKIAIIKDSYANNIVPFLANNFETICLIDMRYFNNDIFEVLHNQNIRDILILYGTSTFSTDASITKIESQLQFSEYLDITGGLVGNSGAVDDDYFADAVFVGDSLTDGLRLYSGAPSEFLSGTGVSVTGVMNVTSADGKSFASQIQNSSAEKFYIMLGINDNIYTDKSIDRYIENYGNFVDFIKENHPDSAIYIQAMLPVSEEREDEEKLNNRVIGKCNERLLDLAVEKDVYFLKVFEPFADEKGFLKSGVTTDGIHLKTEYYTQWYDYLKRHTVPVKPKNGVSSEIKTSSFAGGGEYDLDRLCNELTEGVAFKDSLASTGIGSVNFLYGMEPDRLINGRIMAGGGSTAEEIAVFEYKPEMKAYVEAAIYERIENKKKAYESYMPQEMTKLKNPAVTVKEKIAVLCISDNTRQAEKIIENFLKNQ